jgi:hypothetical protein
MNTARTVIGAQAYLFPAGLAFTVPATGTAGRNSKPGAADTGWINAGVSDWTFVNTGKLTDFMAPAPGARVLYDKIVTSKGLKLKGKLMEMQNLTWQLLLSTLTLPNSPTAGGQYNPLEGDPVIRTWLQLQQYNQANALINTMDVFVAMTLPGDVQFGENPVDVDVEADVLFSTLNTGQLA